MARFLIRRVIFAFLLVFVSSSTALVLTRLAPGDIAASLGPNSTRAEIAAARRWDAIAAALREPVSVETKIAREEPLAPKTTMRVGGAARIYAEPATVADLQALLRAAGSKRLEVFILGRGSNLIVPDEGVDGLVIDACDHERGAGELERIARGDGALEAAA